VAGRVEPLGVFSTLVYFFGEWHHWPKRREGCAVSSAEPAPEATEAGGERKGVRTRRRILEAARRVFADVGYERATIRGIAAAADVDKSSVIQYFGTKQVLFREAVHWDIPIAELTSDDAAETTENLVRGMLAAWAADPNSPMAVLLRTSMTSEDAAELLRAHITAQSVDAMAATIDAPDARLRAALAGAMLMGIVTQRYVLRMPDLKDADVEEILGLVTPLMRALLNPEADT
jgi:AcrR family transcriptional regulator